MTGLQNNDLNAQVDSKDAHRERLSTMMDGGLSADETRFLLRRMEHDDELADCWTRWQFYGDAMRGRVGMALPADFPQRVGRAIADGTAEAFDDQIAVNERHSSRRFGGALSQRGVLLRWGGGATLAASVALVALMGDRILNVVEPVASPITESPATAGTVTSTPMPVTVAAVPQLTNPSTTAELATPLQTDEAPGFVSQAGRATAAALAIAANTRRSREEIRFVRPQVMARGQALSTASTSDIASTMLEPSVGSPSTETGMTEVLTAAAVATDPNSNSDLNLDANRTNPFVPQSDSLTSKPWPRAIISQAAMGGVTVEYSIGPVGETVDDISHQNAQNPFRARSPLQDPDSSNVDRQAPPESE